MPLPSLEEIVVTATQTAPNIDFLTTKSVDGTGVFDVLMGTVKLHLMEEYEAGRVSGAEYTQVYLGALTAVMQQSVTYLLNHQSEEKINAEIGLIRQQTITELANTDDSIPLNLGFNATTSILGVIKGKKDIDALQASLVTSQIASADAEVDLVGQKIISELANTSTDISLAKPYHGYNNENTITTGLIAMQVAKTAKDAELVDSQIETAVAEKALMGQKLITELAQTDDSLTKARLALFGFNSTDSISGLVKLQKDKAVKEEELLTKQTEAVTSEIRLTNQKSITEMAQTADELSPAALAVAFNTDATIEGLVGIQREKAATEKLHVESEIKFTNQKIITEVAQTDDVLSTTALALSMNSSSTITGLTGTQRTKALKEGELIDSNIDTAVAEKALIGQKIITELANTGDTFTNALIDYGYNDSALIEGMLKSQRDKVIKEVELVESQKDSILAEKALTGQKIVTELANTSDNISTPLLSSYGFNLNVAAEGMLKVQKDKAVKEGELIDSQKDIAVAEKALTGQRVITELAQTDTDISNARLASLGYNNTNDVTGLVASQIAKVIKEGELIDSQKDSALAEKALTGQKLVTELAQTSDTLSGPLPEYSYNTSPAIQGILGLEKTKTTAQVSLMVKQGETADAEKDLIGQKIITELASTGDVLTNAQAASHGYNVDGMVKGLVASQVAKVTKEGELVDTQKLSAAAEVVLIHQKTITELANTSDGITTAAAGIGLNDSNSLIEGIVKSQIEKTNREAEYTSQKTATEVAQTHDSIPVGLGMQKAGYVVSGTLKWEKEKAEKEARLLGQKAITELAQTGDSIPQEWSEFNPAGLVPVAGVLGGQKALYTAQKDGYRRDAEQKLAKIMTDAWSVQCSMGDTSGTDLNKLDAANVGSVLTKAITGITS